MKGLGGLSTFLTAASQKAESLGFNVQLSITIRHKILIFKGHLAILILSYFFPYTHFKQGEGDRNTWLDLNFQNDFFFLPTWTIYVFCSSNN